ncbi:MAG: M48 family metalloprotease [Gaiellaceae bacterium]
MRIAALATLSGAWAVAAFLLWPTDVPDLAVGELDPRLLFDAETIARNGRYREVLTGLWALGVLGQLTGLALLAWRRPQLRGHPLVRAALLGGAAYATLWVAQLPFRLAGHWWRRRYDVSDLDYLRYLTGPWSTTLGELLLACVAGAALVGVSRRLGGRACVGLWSTFVAVAAAYVLVYPALLAPRLRPLEDRPLAAEIQTLATRAGLGETTVEVRKARERTRAVNAEAFGAGPTTRVILWDTLLEPNVGRGEIHFAAAHELEHLAQQHPWKGLAWFALLVLPGTWLLGRLVRLQDPAAVPAAALVLVCLQLATLPLATALSRRYEAEADLEALRLTGDRASAEALFRRFVRTSLADPDPPRLLHTLLSTHPTVGERIATARAAELPAAPGSP